jgi:thymidylate synthase
MGEHEEYQYLKLLKEIDQNGFYEEGRNGNTKSIFGNMMRFSLRDGKMPILTTKKVAWKTCLRELLWFIKGDMDNRILKKQNVSSFNEVSLIFLKHLEEILLYIFILLDSFSFCFL